jgi:outer membrane protein insertion porin family
MALAGAVRAQAPAGAPAPELMRLAQAGGVIGEIRVAGNERIEADTIRSYMLVRPGDPFDPERMDRSLKSLYATGLFSDASLHRDGNVLVVTVAENPLVNRIAFEGNHKLSDDTLRPEMQLKPRSVYTAALAQADRQRILDLYAQHGYFAARVEPKIIKQSQNRVDVVFEITDGASTLVSRIIFVGNHAFSESRLRDVINSREEAWWRFLSSSDSYDPDRVNFDKEALRRYYLRNGYADFDVISANAELAPDKSSFFLTFALSEGARYRVSKVTINSTLAHVDAASLHRFLDIDQGDWYDGDAVERTTQALSTEVQNRGFAFVQVRPRVDRNVEKHTIDLTFDVSEGPRVYIERINITGNLRTEDKVIRREFRLAEGDAFNAEGLRRSRQRIEDLDYFNKVEVQPTPGSSPDKTVINTTIEEKATGELSFGGGYSSDIGALLTAGLKEHNLVGTGIDAGITGVIAQQESQIDLSVTDPYFLDRNIVTGFDIFRTDENMQTIAEYNERRIGFTVRAGYEFTEHLRQLWSYSLIDRDVYDTASAASLYVLNSAGETLLSQVSQTITLDYRDSRIDPHSGWVTRLGTDFAGAGGDTRYVRAKLDGAYYYPLDRWIGYEDWGLALQASVGYMFTLGQDEKIIDNFFLGGDNLRGFAMDGVGPHATSTGDSLGGRFIWTDTSEVRFPLPVSKDLGLSGRFFVDVGALSGINQLIVSGQRVPIIDDASPRVGTGFGISWKTPFGLLNIDLGIPVIKKAYDQTQIFRFGFGTRF